MFVLHLPPPVHGSSMVGEHIKESTIINDSFNCRYINLGTSISISDIGQKRLGKIFLYLSILFKVFKELVIFRPHLCYLTITAKGRAFYKDALIVFLVKLFGVKLIYHFHNKGININQNKWFDNLLYRLVLNNSNVILLSKYLNPDIRKYVPKERVSYCPNGLSLSVHTNKPIVEYQSRITVNILFLSNLIESKGVLILLEACKILNEANNNFKCTLAGEIGDIPEANIKKIVNEGYLGDRVNFIKAKYGKDKEEVFLKADIFVLPTYNDCFPLVLLEAMSFALPIISTFEGGIPDIVNDGLTGYLVQQRDSVALAEKIELLIQNPDLRQKMGIAGRKKFIQKFTLDKFENRLTDILLQVI